MLNSLNVLWQTFIKLVWLLSLLSTQTETHPWLQDHLAGVRGASYTGLAVGRKTWGSTVTLVQETLVSRHVQGNPERLVGDRAYDSDPLDIELEEKGIDMIAPHRRNHQKPKSQDGRKLRRCRRRWYTKLEHKCQI